MIEAIKDQNNTFIGFDKDSELFSALFEYGLFGVWDVGLAEFLQEQLIIAKPGDIGQLVGIDVDKIGESLE